MLTCGYSPVGVVGEISDFPLQHISRSCVRPMRKFRLFFWRGEYWRKGYSLITLTGPTGPSISGAACDPVAEGRVFLGVDGLPLALIFHRPSSASGLRTGT